MDSTVRSRRSPRRGHRVAKATTPRREQLLYRRARGRRLPGVRSTALRVRRCEGRLHSRWQAQARPHRLQARGITPSYPSRGLGIGGRGRLRTVEPTAPGRSRRGCFGGRQHGRGVSSADPFALSVFGLSPRAHDRRPLGDALRMHRGRRFPRSRHPPLRWPGPARPRPFDKAQA